MHLLRSSTTARVTGTHYHTHLDGSVSTTSRRSSQAMTLWSNQAMTRWCSQAFDNKEQPRDSAHHKLADSTMIKLMFNNFYVLAIYHVLLCLYVLTCSKVCNIIRLRTNDSFWRGVLQNPGVQIHICAHVQTFHITRWTYIFYNHFHLTRNGEFFSRSGLLSILRIHIFSPMYTNHLVYNNIIANL